MHAIAACVHGCEYLVSQCVVSIYILGCELLWGSRSTTSKGSLCAAFHSHQHLKCLHLNLIYVNLFICVVVHICRGSAVCQQI